MLRRHYLVSWNLAVVIFMLFDTAKTNKVKEKGSHLKVCVFLESMPSS
jgi:hypothetical protein